MDLNTVWFLLVGILIVAYAVLDGFDLGVGSLYYLLAKNDREKRLLIASISPVWDANEVWLITGAAALFAAFPIVYASVFSGFYLVMILVLLGLILRAVAVEFRNHTDSLKWRKTFDALFFSGSFIPALLLGVVVGNITAGIPLNGAYNYTGTFFGLLNPYALLFGVVGLFLFLLQGITWTLLKTEGPVWQRALNLAKPLWEGLLALLFLATIYTWHTNPGMTLNYRTYPLLYAIPGFALLGLVLCLAAIRLGKYGPAFLGSSLAAAGLILTLAAGLFPRLVPARNPTLSLTIYNAASSPLALKAILIIALMGLPLVLFYTVYVYRVFRGKVKLSQTGYPIAARKKRRLGP